MSLNISLMTHEHKHMKYSTYSLWIKEKNTPSHRLCSSECTLAIYSSGQMSVVLMTYSVWSITGGKVWNLLDCLMSTDWLWICHVKQGIQRKHTLWLALLCLWVRYRRGITHSCCGVMGEALICSHCAAKTSPRGCKGIKAVVLLSVK